MTHSFRPILYLMMFTIIVSVGPELHAEGEPSILAPSVQLAGSSVIGPTLLRHISKMRASAIRIEMIQSDDIKLPAEMRVALYEKVVRQVQKKVSSLHVYRDGDQNAAKIPDLLVLRSTLRGFTKSEEKRQVTTVAGATPITLHCEFTNTQGKVLLERDIRGKVRFFGANLEATNDFAKKAAAAAGDNFSATGI